MARGLLVWTGLALLTELLITPLHVVTLGAATSPAATASAARLTGDLGAVLGLRLGLGAAALAALVVAGRAVSDGGVRGTRDRLIVMACGLVLLSELTGRFLFYAARVRVGI